MIEDILKITFIQSFETHLFKIQSFQNSLIQ
jgi:hypothetical protein